MTAPAGHSSGAAPRKPPSRGLVHRGPSLPPAGPPLLQPPSGAVFFYRSVTRFTRAATGTLGTSNSTDPRRDPHSGHINRLSRPDNGKFGPRVMTRVFMSSSAL